MPNQRVARNRRLRYTTELKIRLQSLDRAEATVCAPLEIWRDRDPKKHYETYVSILTDGSGQKRVINVVVRKETYVYSWHLNAVKMNHARNGRLVYRKH